MSHLVSRLARVLTVGLVALQGSFAVAQTPETTPPAGLRERAPSVHALVGGRIVIAPGQVLESGTLVIRDGRITEVGPQVALPPDARVWDLTGQTLYAGFIDAAGEVDLPAPAQSGPTYWNRQIRPELAVAAQYQPDVARAKQLRGQGITARLVAPAAGLIKGTSTLELTGDRPAEQALLAPRVALHIDLTLPARGERDDYPSSPMGAVALVRQALYDAAWYRDAWAAYQADPRLGRPEQNQALEALAQDLADKLPVVINAPDELYFLRASRLASEFGLNVLVRGSGREYRRLAAVVATGLPVIVPVNFPPAPGVQAADVARSVPLARLLHWDHAPENAARLQAAGVVLAFTSQGLADTSKFLTNVRRCVQRGLPADAALAALTTTPARLFGVTQDLGSLEVGKLANLIATTGELFDDKTQVVTTWVEGRPYEVQRLPTADLRGGWDLVVARPDGGSESWRLELTGKPQELAGSVRRLDLNVPLQKPTLDGGQLIATWAGETWGKPGNVQLSLTVLREAAAPPMGSPAGAAWTLLGRVAWPDGSVGQVRGRFQGALPPAAEPGTVAPAATPPQATPTPATPSPSDAQAPAATPPPTPAPVPIRALYEVNFPLGGMGLTEPPAAPPAVVFRNATVWTCGPAGTLSGASVLVENGKITAVGTELTVPAGALEIDATGKHLAPGIVDCHSHIATDGGVNEAGQSITAEVRIGDFINPDDINLYRQLAGGVTCANILHGSANTIGGQNQVIKFRWGLLPEELKFAEAPQGIKFALGENVKQSNWGDRFTNRYPQSRMGVEQLLRDAFRAAREYRQRWTEWNAAHTGLPPRRDLELDALAEVLDGSRFIHCHSYRQDEIVALLRVCEEFGVQVRTLQHILEGYKVADAIAKHGAGGSSFADWWAYKFEVYDAIPYNGALMHRAGVIMSFNSDDAEMARHLNLEAAKAVKYGGLSPEDALRFVTLNPARQLGIEGQVGSLEQGKDADLVVWSAPPLSTRAVCEQTWIDGRKYFDRVDDQARRQRAEQMRAALIQRALTTPDAGGEETPDPRDMWARHDEYCGHCRAAAKEQP